MKSLKRQDTIHLEANEELERITPQFRVHPDVLELRWKIYAKEKKWDGCLAIAETLTDVVPRRASAWFSLATTLHCLDQTEEACETLLEVLDEFPDNPAFPYQLACYFCRLEQFSEAKQWLEKAFSMGDSKELKLMALKDPELKLLWERIGKL